MVEIPSNSGRGSPESSPISRRPDEELVDALSGLATTVHLGGGLDELQVVKVRRLLAEARVRWAASELVPKEVASVLVEWFPAMYGSTGSYPELAAEHIMQIAMNLVDDVLAALK